MPEKGSLRKGNNQKTGQKYKNLTAFKHNKNSKLTKKIESLPVQGLCQRCFEIVQWRKQYRKYKPLTAPKKCVNCQQKTVRDAYHILCDPCATAKQCCAKCQGTESEIVPPLNKELDLLHEQQERVQEETLLHGISERHRRTYRRKMMTDEEDARVFLEECHRRVAAKLGLGEDGFSDFDESDEDSENSEDDEQQQEDHDSDDGSDEEDNEDLEKLSLSE